MTNFETFVAIVCVLGVVRCTLVLGISAFIIYKVYRWIRG